jgi:pyridoxine 5-phosphate synthase
MTRLSVNINKIALIRNSRGSNNPNLLVVAKDCESFGAHGITVHPRPDQRHIRYDDVFALKEVVTSEFNVECNPTSEILDILFQVKPHQVTLVPDAPGALTSDAGWDTVNHGARLKDITRELKALGMRVSVFVDPDLSMVEGAAECGVDRIELYTGEFAKHFKTQKEPLVKMHSECSLLAGQLGLGVNAGHDLNLINLKYYKNNLVNLDEVSIGHALIIDAMYFGLQNSIAMYLHELI